MALRTPIPTDDLRHKPISDDPFAGESWYFNCIDPKANIGIFMRVGLYPNRNRANVSVLIAMNGKEAYNRQMHGQPLPAGDLDSGLSLGGLTLQAIQLGHHFTLTFADVDSHLQFNLEWESITPLVDSSGRTQEMARAGSGGHFEQSGRAWGSFKYRDQDLTLSGIGNRDHAVGARNWESLHGHDLAWPVFEDGTVVCLLKAHPAAGGEGEMSWVWDGNQITRITKSSRFDVALDALDKPLTVSIEAVDEVGRAWKISGQRMAVCHWPTDAYLMNECPCAYQLEDGRTGHGLLEVGVRLGPR